MLRVLLLIFLFLFVRWFVLRLVLPIMKLTRMTHQKMKDMNKQMNQNQMRPEKPRKVEGEYIEYEEVK